MIARQAPGCPVCRAGKTRDHGSFAANQQVTGRGDFGVRCDPAGGCRLGNRAVFLRLDDGGRRQPRRLRQRRRTVTYVQRVRRPDQRRPGHIKRVDCNSLRRRDAHCGATASADGTAGRPLRRAQGNARRDGTTRDRLLDFRCRSQSPMAGGWLRNAALFRPGLTDARQRQPRLSVVRQKPWLRHGPHGAGLRHLNGYSSAARPMVDRHDRLAAGLVRNGHHHLGDVPAAVAAPRL